MLTRWLRFYWERCVSQAVGIAACAIALDLLTQFVLGAARVRFSWVTLLVLFTSVLLGLAIRCSDELRDVEVDRIYFPSRPLVTGRISRRDVIWFATSAVALSVMINAVWMFALSELVATVAFLYLVTRWFFIPQILSKNRFLAVVSNLPFFFTMNLYTVVASARFHGLHERMDGKSWILWVIALWMLLPMHSYEFARKTMMPQEEKPGYQTYSSMVDFRWAALIGFAFAAVHFVVFLLYSNWRQSARGASIGLGVLLCLYAIVLLRYVNRRCASSRDLEGSSGFYYMGGMVLLSLGAFGIM